MMAFILDPDGGYELDDGKGANPLRVLRFVPHRPGKDAPYYAIYCGPIGPNPDFEADSWAEVLAYLSQATGWTEAQVEAKLRSSRST